MKILLTGYTGMLGSELLLELVKDGHIFFDTTLKYNEEFAQKLENINKWKPDLVINCAAYTNVDNAENKESLEATYANIHIPYYLSRSFDCPIIHFSSDYIFPGTLKKNQKYKETDKTLLIDCVNFYGMTKLRAEEYIRVNNPNHYIFRLSLLFGHNKNNFMHKAINGGEYPKLWDEQYGTITYVNDVVNVVKFFIENKPKYGTYHVCNGTDKPKTKIDYVKEATRLYNPSVNIDEYLLPSEIFVEAPRPYNSALNNNKLLKIYDMPSASDAINRFVKRSR